MITLKRFNGALVTPRDDALLHDFVVGSSGIFEGVTVSHLGSNQLAITAGRGIVLGRDFAVDAETKLATLSDSGTKKGRLIIRIDVSNSDAPAQFVTQMAAVLPALVQEDINRGGTIYEMPIATYDVTELLVSNLVMVTVKPLESVRKDAGGNVAVSGNLNVGNSLSVGGTDIKAITVRTLTHSRAGTVHTLTGLPTAAGLYTAQFKATADYNEGDTFAGGYAAKAAGEDTALPDKAFVSGDLVSIVVDVAGKRLGFKAGGGGAKLNVFAGMTQPTATDGVWAKTSAPVNKVLVMTPDDISVAGTWGAKASMPSGKSGFGMGAVGPIIYCTGGGVETYAYDTATNLWSTKASMPNVGALASGRAYAIVGTIMYCMGGKSGADGPTSAVNQAYDTATNLWSTKASMYAARIEASAASVGSIVYCLCGYSSVTNGSSSTSTNQAYDTVTNLWSTKTAAPRVENNSVVISVGNRIYLIGGNGTGTRRSNAAYDTLTGLWSSKTNAVSNVFRTASAAVGTIIYCIGGYDAVNVHQAYDTVTDLWSTKTAPPTPREYASAAAVGDIIYCIGGSNNEAFDISGTPLLDGTLVIQNYGLNGNKAKLISDKKAKVYTYIKPALAYQGGKQTVIETYSNYDNTGWTKVN